ncbi:MAG TPA: nuclear transport factor 2 family protein [Ferruginibacter sp.]|nr:nuclear transport factor 2 family protein [Ferruginibacter sp.]
MKKSAIYFSILFAVLSLAYTACSSPENKPAVIDTATEKTQISAMLDSFNRAAAKADYKAYFDFYTEDAIFTGTDATERWDKKQFMVWAKPFFDRGKAWSFTSIERNIYFDKTGNLAWFDELLNTQMKICRGSGVVVKQGNAWKVNQYILSTTIPNDQLDSVIKMKSHVEDSIINTFGKK